MIEEEELPGGHVIKAPLYTDEEKVPRAEHPTAQWPNAKWPNEWRVLDSPLWDVSVQTFPSLNFAGHFWGAPDCTMYLRSAGVTYDLAARTIESDNAWKRVEGHAEKLEKEIRETLSRMANGSFPMFVFPETHITVSITPEALREPSEVERVFDLFDHAGFNLAALAFLLRLERAYAEELSRLGKKDDANDYRKKRALDWSNADRFLAGEAVDNGWNPHTAFDEWRFGIGGSQKITFDHAPRVEKLAKALWNLRVRPQLAAQLDREERHPAALTRTVSVDVLDAYSRRYREEERDGQRTLIFPQHRGWIVVPSVTDKAISAILSRGFDLLGTELGIDLLEWQITTAHQQWQRGDDDFRNIRVEGGWRALASERLGKNSKADVENVRKIVLTQAHMRFETGGRTGNLLAYDESVRATRGRRSVVTITLGDMLLKGFVHALKETHGNASLEAREGQRLVPILGKAPLVGKQRNSYAAQRRLVWRFAIALRDKAKELVEEGGVRLAKEDWERLASEAGLPRSTSLLEGIKDAWQKGDDHAPALIVLDGDRVKLHESRKTASDFIEEAGRRSIASKSYGERSARKRAAPKRKAT